MKRTIVVADDFYADPDAVVRYALSQRFYSPYANNTLGSSEPEAMARARWYSTIFKEAADCPFKSSKDLIAKLEHIVGEKIDLEHWNKSFPENPDGTIVMPRPDVIDQNKPVTFDNLRPDAISCRWNCAFNVKLRVHELGTGVHNHMKDIWNSVGPDGWAGTIYFNKNPPQGSGLRLFKNKNGNDLEWMTAADRWELVDEFANVYNRLVLVRGSVPHVGGSGFGTDIATGRLFQTFFFKTERVDSMEPCYIGI
jgi:hypothetical protein